MVTLSDGDASPASSSVFCFLVDDGGVSSFHVSRIRRRGQEDRLDQGFLTNSTQLIVTDSDRE